jgi:hypothetical protein
VKIKKFILCLLVAGLGWVWSGAARATEIKLEFTGKIIYSTLGDPAFAAGTTYTGDLTYDLSAPDLSPADPNYGAYLGIGLAVSFSTGATATCVGQPSIFVENNFAGEDSFKVGADFAVTGSSLPLIASLEFKDSNQTAFASDSLSASFSLSDFDSKDFWFLCVGQPQKFALGSIETNTFDAAPLPASLLLFGTALAGWLAAGTIRRRKRFF